MATTENLDIILRAQVLIKDEPKLEMNFEEIFKNNEFLRLLKENVTKDKEEGKKQ